MTTPDSPPLLVIIVPDHTVTYRARAIPDLPEFADILGDFDLFQDDKDESDPDSDRRNATAKVCYADEKTCTSSTTCFGRGSCALKSTKGDGECWGCKCNSGYAGVSCQKEDYSMWVPYVTLLLNAYVQPLRYPHSVHIVPCWHSGRQHCSALLGGRDELAVDAELGYWQP